MGQSLDAPQLAAGQFTQVKPEAKHGQRQPVLHPVRLDAKALSVEEITRSPQSRVDQATVRHVALVLVTYVVLERLKIDPSETQGDVKRHFQLQAITGGAKPPESLHARAA